MKTGLRYRLRLLSVILFASILCGVLTATGAIKWNNDSPDAVSSATAQVVSAEDMKGKYVVLINKELHDHTGTTEDWIKFFSFDKETPLIMEDIVCKTADTDAQGIEVAEKYRARLPENQMKLQKEAGVMLLSKAELGRFDVVILSEAAAQNYSAQTMYDRNNVAVIKM